VQCAAGLALAHGCAHRAHDDGVSTLISHDYSLSRMLSIYDCIQLNT
jgi:hypothetical protein